MTQAAPSEELALLARGVGSEGAALLRPHLEAVDLSDGATVFVDGDPSAHLILVVSGELAIRHEAGAHAVEMGTRGPGSWLGEVGFIDPGPATATVVSRGKSRVLRIEHAKLLGLTDERPEVASILLRHVSRQLAERLATSSAGIVERVAPGHVSLRKPEDVRSWVSTVLGWLVGGESR